MRTVSKIRLVASSTYPLGFEITNFNSVDIPEKDIQKSVGLNGDLIIWKKSPNPHVISVVRGSESDKNLEILLKTNNGNQNANDVIQLNYFFDGGNSITYGGGVLAHREQSNLNNKYYFTKMIET